MGALKRLYIFLPTLVRFWREHRARLEEGVRLTLSFVIPLGICGLVDEFELGLLVGFGGIQVAMADLGGSYRKKAASMAATGLTVMLAAFCGSVASAHTAAAVATAFTGALLCGLAGLYGHTAASNSIPVLATLTVTMGFPATAGEALSRSLALGAGGAWAMLLSLWLWPFRPYGPSRTLTGRCYGALARLIREEILPALVEALSSDGRPPVQPARDAATQAIRSARETLTENRKTRQGFSSTGQDLLFLNANAEQLYSLLIALSATAGLARRRGLPQTVESAACEALEQMSMVLAELEPAIEAGGGEAAMAGLRQRLTGLTERVEKLAEGDPEPGEDLQSDSEVRHFLLGLQNCVRLAALAVQTTRALGQGGDQHHSIPMLEEEPRRTAGVLETLRDNLSRDSLIFRYALRLGVAVALAVGVSRLYHIERGYWVPMTVALILKPDFGGTRAHALGRIAGTLAGGLAGAALDVLIQDRLLNYLLLFPIGVATFAQRTASYPRFVAFLTTFIVLMLNLITPGDLRLPILRIVDTALGGCIALLAGYLLWPAWEYQSFPDRLAAAISANRRYVGLVLRCYQRLPVDEREISAARAEALLEVSNTGVSFQRLLSEPAARRGDSEPYYALAVANRQIFDATTALLAHGPPAGSDYDLPALDKFASAVDYMMHELEEAVRDRRVAEDLPDLEEVLEDFALEMENASRRRMAERARRQEVSASRRMLRDHSAAARLLHLIADELTAMDRALFRLCGQPEMEPGSLINSKRTPDAKGTIKSQIQGQT
jgi:uncharacterized membrane protein YccC